MRTVNAWRTAKPELPFASFPCSFSSAVFENWESEFLQMSAYVMLTAVLFQRGSAELADPDEPNRPRRSLSLDAPRQGIVRWLYAHSLGLALAVLFAVSLVFHWLTSVKRRQ